MVEVHDRDKVILVVPDRAGKPPIFGGDAGNVHQTVVERMRRVLRDHVLPPYLDNAAAELLLSARAAYKQSGLDSQSILLLGEDRHLLAPWTGTIGTASLAVVLASLDYRVGTFDGVLEVKSAKFGSRTLLCDLKAIAAAKVDLVELVRNRAGALAQEKFHRYLGDDLLVFDTLSSRLDLEAVPKIARSLCSHN